jgi:pyruvate/2-oxoglutarate dehydrogenase complex dihydrolipoamide dehydrogenase (E3) component
MYDVVIIGAGSAGIEAAKEARKYKLKTLLIEKNPESFGGVCLNKGCIPTKLYLNFTKTHKDLGSVFKEKDKVIRHIKESTLNYLKTLGVEFIWGQAQFVDNTRIEVEGRKLEAKNIIIATGSLPKKIIDTKDEKIIFAEDIFNLAQLPSKFLIIGAGAIGLEIASLLSNISKDVLLVDKENQILPWFEEKITARLRLILERKGIKVKTNFNINEANFDDFDLILTACGRVPNKDNLKLDKAGVVVDKNGRIIVNEYMQTNQEHIYACGDVVSEKMYAYVSEYQARICIKNIAGEKITYNPLGIPECVFTIPQLAKVGLDENQAKRLNLKYRVVRSNFMRFSSSYVYQDIDGFMKVIVDDKGSILGAAIISNLACEIISTFSLGIRHNLSLEQLKDTVLIHPTLSEIIPSLLRG